MPEDKNERVEQQPGQQQVTLRVDESKMASSYANAFRTHATAEEVILDFGLNLPGAQQVNEGIVKAYAEEGV